MASRRRAGASPETGRVTRGACAEYKLRVRPSEVQRGCGQISFFCPRADPGRGSATPSLHHPEICPTHAKFFSSGCFCKSRWGPSRGQILTLVKPMSLHCPLVLDLLEVTVQQTILTNAQKKGNCSMQCCLTHCPFVLRC